MLFLMNDVVFDLDEACPAPSHDLRRFSYLDLEAVLGLGCELYSEEPRLHHKEPVRARRLAWLIAHRCEGINAARFSAPEAGCEPMLVEPRLCALPAQVMGQLQAQARHGRDTVAASRAADQLVWNPQLA